MRGWLCNAGLAGALLACAGCRDEAPVAPVPDAAASPPLIADAAPLSPPPSPPPPVPPLTVLTRLPDPPAFAAVAPGAAAGDLRAARPDLVPSVYTDRILQQRLPPEAPFTRVAYLLDAEDRVRGILLTFAGPYRPADRWREVLEAARTRLGEGEAFIEPPYEGTRWAVPGWRVDLRVDTSVGEPQLLFHARGGRDLDLP